MMDTKSIMFFLAGIAMSGIIACILSFKLYKLERLNDAFEIDGKKSVKTLIKSTSSIIASWQIVAFLAAGIVFLALITSGDTEVVRTKPSVPFTQL